MTPLDAAHAEMTAAPDDATARLRWYGLLADAPLWLWLSAEPDGDDLAPRVFDLPDGPAVLAFDTPDRMAEVAGHAAYAELPGRVVAQALAGQGVALGVNLGAAAPAFLVPPDAVAWLASLVTAVPVRDESAGTLAAPGPVSGPLVAALAARLAGVAEAASLLRVDGELVLVVLGPRADEASVARAAGEAATFCGPGETVSVAFPEPGSPLARAALRLGLALDLTVRAVPPPAAPVVPRPPGTDPARPPKLR